MEIEYFYCNACGFEDSNVDVDYIRTVANDDIFSCLGCKSEVLIDEGDL